MMKPSAYVGPERSAPDTTITPVKRGFQYRELLERLLDSPKNSVLRVKNVGIRYAFEKQARALGYQAVFAQRDGWLYVKIGGVLNEERRRSGDGVNGAHKSVLKALATAPMTATEVARILRSDSASCEAILSHLVEGGFVERDDGLGKPIYRAMAGVRYGE